ncbi:hypothetical protein D7V86_11525 [bacterium D16-51]|nr:hypothetical protein D7V96_13045 [bacterium D16-59]RKI59799.1 hypothetical protein D7V86_11525 [bacterium D16-51]
MKIIGKIMAAVLALSLMAGYGSIHTKQAALAAKTFKIKADVDFTLKLPESWRNNYVIKRSKSKKQGSYVAFFSKKCYQQTTDGWLFSIMRYKDDSYMDMPQYELAGKWNGFNYVAVFPTDIQTFGATKAAKKQYLKLSGGVDNVIVSIRPAERRKEEKGVCRFSDFSLKLPESWKNNYIVEMGKGNEKENSYVAFCAKECYNQTKLGWLFSIGRFTDESYQELPDYELVGMWNGVSYVAIFPTDVQFDGVTEEAAAQYQKLDKSVKKVVRSIAP